MMLCVYCVCCACVFMCVCVCVCVCVCACAFQVKVRPQILHQRYGVRKALVKLLVWLLVLSLAPFFPSPRSKSSSVCRSPSIFFCTLSHTHTFSHFSWKKKNTQGCLLDLVLYQIKLYSTCLPECCAPHGCTFGLKVSVVISLYPAKERGHSGSLSRVHMATAEFVEL